MEAHILAGKDKFRRQLRLAALKQEHLEPGMEALNLVQVENPELKDFISIVKTPAWGMSTKLIIIKDFKLLENKSSDKEVEQVVETLKNLPDTVLLIFDSEKVSGTIKLVKQIKKLPGINFEEFKAFSPWDTKAASAWIINCHRDLIKELKSEAKAMAIHIAEHFVEHIGTEESSKLYSELKRLVILGKEITVELINEECRSKYDIFKFIRELANGNRANANKELEKIIFEKEAHLGLVSILETTVSKYLKLKLAEQDRLSQNETAEILGISPQRLFYQKKEVAKMSVNHLEQLLELSLDTERKVKSGRMPIENALRVLVNS